MKKQRRTVLSDIVNTVSREPVPIELEEVPIAPPRRNATKQATIQQTLYLPPAVHDQLRELAFVERVRMHALLLEGLDEVFRKRGMRPLSELDGKQ